MSVFAPLGVESSLQAVAKDIALWYRQGLSGCKGSLKQYINTL